MPLIMVDAGPESASRTYYDEFSRRYDERRGGRVPHGYHDLIDDLEVGFVERFGTGKQLLEVGCGTGLLLERFKAFCAGVKGIDLSPGMLEHARARGLDVTEGSATDLPFDEASFDLAVSFKVLAHVPDIRQALIEMARVVRPGGFVIAEFYNPFSVRALAKRIAGARAISHRLNESAVFTRFDTPSQVRDLLPPNMRVVAERGIRIVTPAAGVLELPVVGELLWKAEHLLADTPLKRLGGFYVVAAQKA